MNAIVDWENADDAVLLNPKLSSEDRKKLLGSLHIARAHLKGKGHIFLTSSGTSGALKLVALSKEAVLCSAKAVNSHLKSDHRDIWINPLPIFHVGGLAISARGFLSGAKVYAATFSKKWDPSEFVLEAEQKKATLTSLVPTQLYDIVLRQIPPPSSLRVVIIGGGALSEKLYAEAICLGWKILPSYGLTECSSQVATAKIESCEKAQEEQKLPLLYPLSHVQTKNSSDGYLMIKSRSLFEGYIDTQDNIWKDPKNQNWLTTEDRVEWLMGAIKSISRNQDFIKIGGESVDMVRLEKIFEEEKLTLKIGFDCAIVAFSDARLGSSIHLLMTKKADELSDLLISNFKSRVTPFEQIRKVHYVETIPRSSLNKVLKSSLFCSGE